MSARVRTAALWLCCSALLLSAGFLAVVALGLEIATARSEPAAAASLQAIFGVYASVVLIKGLLPALALTLALWAGLDHRWQISLRGARVTALAVLVAAALGSVIAAATLLPLRVPGLPAVHFNGIGNFLRTCAEMAGPVALAAWLPSWILPRLRRHRALVLAGMLVVLMAGSSSLARFGRRPAPVPAPQPAPAHEVPAAPTHAPTASEGAQTSAGIPISALPLQLLATAVGATPDQSVALIADIERVVPHLMREGNAFGRYPGVRLTSIAASLVLIDNQGRTERLELNPDLSALRPASAPAAEPSREELERRRALAQRVRERIAAGPHASEVVMADGLFAEGEPVPIYEAGEFAGIELRNLRPDGLYAQIGLRDGDRVAAINGVSLAAPDASGAILHALAQSPQVELSVEHSDGSPDKLTVPRDRLFEALQALD